MHWCSFNCSGFYLFFHAGKLDASDKTGWVQTPGVGGILAANASPDGCR
jgi:hypothetical protein